MKRRHLALSSVLLTALALVFVSKAGAQDIEPRAYANAPVGVNFMIAGYLDGRGAPSFDPALPITDAHLQVPTAVLAYARVLDLWGKSAKLDVITGYSWLSGDALYVGQPVSREVDGLADPRVRLSVNFHGAPALRLREYAKYRQDVIVGASLQVQAPLGQYDDMRLVNIGSHRWTFKPEVGVSKAAGPWTLELMGAAMLFTDNPDFYNGKLREQAPIYSGQAHVIYGFRSGIWLAGDANYFTGGRTTVNGDLSDDLQQNWRLGGVLAVPVNKRNSIKLHASDGVWARTNSNFTIFGLAWQTRWGGGL